MHALILLVATAVSSAGSDQSQPIDEFNALFANTCMQHFYSQEKLPGQLEKHGLERLPPEQAEFFLGGTEGTAWLMLTPSNRYVVSLRKDTLCSVFAQRGKRATVEAGFQKLVGSAPQPFLVRNKESGPAGPNDDQRKTITRAWTRPGDATELLFVLTTSTREDATAQVMASMALVSSGE